ncbi:hypothetical protein M378DRAFT_19283 [Amanita muscaria Koide BX008]|uniref:HTH CENPB-type domain-containing protein n=1 Tax=Amanita muscaria (strain Koide BX008) TaxID=946122 RepID=A0A0C2WDD2_AMAMK|nr:hypothetical protein M378DRAFT_19283 [Amanita muscaria Koide BX008]
MRKTSVCLGTIRNRALSKHGSARKAHSAQQLLSHSQENVLVDWIILLSETGHSIGKEALRRKAELICGQTPGETWVYHCYKLGLTL